MVLGQVRGGVVSNGCAECHALLQVVQALGLFLVLREHLELVALAVRDHFFLCLPLEVETAADHQLLGVGQIGRQLVLLLWEGGPVLAWDPEVSVDGEEGVLRPLAGQFVSVEVAHVALAFLTRHVEQFVCLNHPHFLRQLQPQTTFLVRLPRGVPATTPQTVVFEPHCHFRLSESVPHSFSPK